MALDLNAAKKKIEFSIKRYFFAFYNDCDCFSSQ